VPTVTGGSIAAHRRITSDRIFTAFSDLLYERGYDAITLADVARAAGMSRTTMYNYFPDKDSLVVAFTDHEASRYLVDLESTLAVIENPVDRLRTFVAEQLNYFATHHLPPGRALRVALSGNAYERVLQHVGVLEQLLRDILRDGADDGYMVVDDIEATVAMVTACINRSGPADYAGSDIDDSIEVTATFVLRALGVRLGANGRPRRRARAASSA
jgi:AcrR family transcriptional regulator